MVAFIFNLSPIGLLLFGALMTSMIYFLTFAVSKNNIFPVLGALIGISVVVSLFLYAHDSASTSGDVGFNLAYIFSIFLFVLGSAIGFIVSFKILQYFKLRR